MDGKVPENESVLYRVALGLNRAARGSRLGPGLARAAYGVWEAIWRVYLAARFPLRGTSADFMVAGHRIRMDLRDRTVTRALYLFRLYEPIETRCFVGLFRMGMTVVDIGANTGYYTILAAMGVGPHGKVIAFEPYPPNADLLRRNVALNNLGNVRVEACAVASRTGPAALYLCSINEGDHRVYDGDDDGFYNAGRARERIPVAAVALDDYVERLGLDVDLMKVDIQGAEHSALMGMRRTLSARRELVLMSEFWPHGLLRSGTRPEEFLGEMGALGFRTFEGLREGGFRRASAEEVLARVRGRNSTILFFSRAELV